MREKYNYYSAITSQLPFCSTPLRLDSFNACQFSCAYCYASTRQGFGRDESLKVANPETLSKKLKRISEGNIKSSLDEFISNRIPFQLGGMSDPFTKMELKSETTLRILEVLKEHNYPYLISTKSTLLSDDRYITILRDSNVYVRFSTTIIENNIRHKIDKGCPELSSILDACNKLSSAKIPISLRFQPVIPGHEQVALELIDSAYQAGVSHISAEYLKVPIDANLNFGKELKTELAGNPIQFYKSLGAQKFGREYVLPQSYKSKYLPAMYNLTKSRGMTFGFADNEFLVHSDGGACCNASNIYLKDANFFSANIIGIAKKKSDGELIKFDEIINQWHPKLNISRHINSKGRLPTKCFGETEWITYQRKMWLGNHGVFAPDYFDGIIKTDSLDHNGLPIYRRTTSDFEKLLDF